MILSIPDVIVTQKLLTPIPTSIKSPAVQRLLSVFYTEM